MMVFTEELRIVKLKLETIIKNKLMEKEFVPYKESLALKELGFDEKCLAVYREKKLVVYCEPDFMATNTWCKTSKFSGDGKFTAPLYQQVFIWFWNKYKLEANFGYFYTFHEKVTYKYSIFCYDKTKGYTFGEAMGIATLEKARLDCIKELIKIVKENVPRI